MEFLAIKRKVVECQQTTRGVLNAIKRSREGGISDDESEGESSQETQPYGPSFRGPPPSNFAPDVPEDPAIQVLHQLCAFEQVLQEVIAEKDGLKKSPIKASLRVELDFKDIIKPYLVKYNRTRDQGVISQCIREITDTQLKRNDNIVPEHWLKLIENSFLSFLSIGSLHLQSCPEIEGQIGLYQQNALATKALHLKDLQFVVLSFPEEIDDISEAGFEEGLTFEHEVNGREITLIGLGPARTINHSCEPNVYWELETETLDYLPDGFLPNIGFTCLPIERVEGKSINRGQQLTAFYSVYFAENLCDCKYPTYHQQGKRAGSSSDSEYDPEDSEDETKPITNPFMRSKTKSKMEFKRCPSACEKVAGIPARMTKVNPPHKATRMKGRWTGNNVCLAGSPPVIQPPLSSMHSMKHFSSPIKRKLPSDGATMAKSDQQKPKAVRVEITSLHWNPKQANQQSILPAVQEHANKKYGLAQPSLSVSKTSPPGPTQSPHSAESESTKISPIRDAIDLSSNISDQQHPIISTPTQTSNAATVLQAFLNSQQIVINQQELLKAQMADPKVTEATIRETQGMLPRLQDTQNKLGEMLWGERSN